MKRRDASPFVAAHFLLAALLGFVGLLLATPLIAAIILIVPLGGLRGRIHHRG